MESKRNSVLLRMNSPEVAKPILAMAFVNMQPLDELYSLDDAFCNGTLFVNLNKPYLGGPVDEKR